jgi:hypothetical protein
VTTRDNDQETGLAAEKTAADAKAGNQSPGDEHMSITTEQIGTMVSDAIAKNERERAAAADAKAMADAKAARDARIAYYKSAGKSDASAEHCVDLENDLKRLGVQPRD